MKMRWTFYIGWCLIGFVFSEVIANAEEVGIAIAPRSEKEALREKEDECICVRNSEANGLETGKT